MQPTPVIAIIDVGKTNKKIFLFDQQYRIVHEHTSRFDETTDEDGFACEDVQLLSSWTKNILNELEKLKDFSICAINFSAYGASLVHIDEEGNFLLPLYNYLKPYPTELKNKFFNAYGGEKNFSMITASPVLDSLNSGLQLYRMKYEKSILNKPGYSLHLPQYLSFLITGKKYSDLTSIGCHTMFWDFQNNNYHPWIYAEGVDVRLAPVFSGEAVIQTMFYDRQIPVGVGLHDSSAALIPYLMAFQQPFILISTGTWCISLNPFNDEALTARELEQDCLNFISYKGKTVKASRLFAGNEHEKAIKILAAHFQTQENYYETIMFQKDTVNYLEKNIQQFAGPNDSIGPFLFRQRDLSLFKNYETAYHQLMMDIMRQQKISTSLLMKDVPVSRIFVDGGFAKNAVYMHLLAIAFPDVEVYAASVSQATAMGAALAIHDSWNKNDVPSDMINLKYYSGSK